MSRIDGTIVFTDLDGTLLDHGDYSFIAAQPVLSELASLNVPVIPVTSKTRAELLSLREKLKLDTPFVVENGAAIYVPKGYFSFNDDALTEQDEFWCKAFAPSRKEWVAVIDSLPNDIREKVTTFTELGNNGIVELTDLTLDQVALANDREYSEPMFWQGDDALLEAFKVTVKSLGFDLLQGGRFLHLTSGYDKGQALAWLKQQFMRAKPNEPQFAIALGDSGNDIDMLEAADQAIVIKNPHSKDLELDERIPVLRSVKEGPAGWAETLNSYLNLGLG